MTAVAVTPGAIRRLAAALAAIFLLVHLRALPRTLEDIDSINFAMGVESFDVSAHRPHPPGYPVFMVMAKASTAAVGVLAPTWDRDRRAAVGLAIWGVVGGALAAFVLVDFWIAVGLSPLLAWLAALVAVTSPLFWFTASRPLTDSAGLVAGLLVQTWLIRGWRAWRADPERLPAVWWWGAAAAGFVIGMRSQTMWLTGPLAAWIVGEMAFRRQLRHALLSVAAAAAGAFAWAIPLLVVSGGLSAYLGALGSQGAEDFYAELVVARPSWDLLKAALDRTFVQPWEVAGLGNVVLGLAVIGLVRLGRRAPGVLATLVLGFWPYLVFHVLFLETVTIRYALPEIIPVAGLAIVGLATLGSAVAIGGAVVMAIVSLVVAQPRLMAYAAQGSPVFVAFQEMQRELPNARETPLVRMHHQVWWGVRRVTEWYKPVWDAKLPPHPGEREWLDVVEQIRQQPSRPVWFLTDLTRNDVALFDRRGRELGGQFALDPEIRRVVGGYRLDGLAWWKIERPLWMLGRGWALTPEIAGMTDVDNREPHLVPAEGWIRRPSAAETNGHEAGLATDGCLIGGRYLSGSGAALIRFEIDGRCGPRVHGHRHPGGVSARCSPVRRDAGRPRRLRADARERAGRQRLRPVARDRLRAVRRGGNLRSDAGLRRGVARAGGGSEDRPAVAMDQ